MGSLSNLYISQSYQSLIHIATNNTASATLIDLQDGLGNSIGVAVNTSGNLYLSGSLTASLQQGYLYVGGASGKTYAFPTSSLVTNINTGSLVTTASFNAYTASNDSKVNQLINATSSYAISSSVAAVDAAQQSQINNLIAATGSYLTSSVPLTSLNAFTASQNTKNATLAGVTSSLQAFTQSQQNLNSTFATTGSNTFYGNQTISTGSILRVDEIRNAGPGDNITIAFDSGANLYINMTNPSIEGVYIDGGLNVTNDITASNLKVGTINATTIYTVYETSSIIYSSGSNQFGDELTDIQTLSGSVKVQGSLTVNGTNVLTSSIPLDSLNAFTSSQNTKNTTLENVTASLQAFTASQQILNGTFATTSSFNSYTSSTNSRLNNIEAATSSYVTESETGSFVTNIENNPLTPLTLTYDNAGSSTNVTLDLPANIISSSAQITSLGFVSSSVTASSLITASLSGQTLTFTKGNGTTFGIVLPDVSGSDITSLNAFTASQLTINTGYNTFTQSIQTEVDSLQAETSSYAISSSVAAVDAAQQAQINSLINATSSYADSASFAASQLAQDNRINDLSAQTSSYITESETASFARTNVDNNFTANQTFTNITAVSASFTYVQTTYETSSIIYSSGSNQFGDELSDIQTLSGSVKVQGSLTVNGTPVLTSSVDISGLVTTASFNAYTQSNDQRVSSLEVNSASVNTSITNINSATASLFTSASLGLVTASFSGNTLTFTKGDTSTFGVVIPDVSGSTIPAGTISGSSQITALGFVSSSITASSLVTASVSLNTITFTKGDASTFNIIVNTGSAITTDITSLNAFTQSQETKDTTLANVTSSLNSATASLFTSASLALVTASFDNGTRNLTFTKGDTQTFSVNIPDVSGSAGNFVTTSSFNSYTSSTDSRLTNIESTTASLNSSITNINSFTQSANQRIGSLEAATSSYVTSAITASSLVTASVNLNTITFTKGDASTFNITVNTGSGGGGSTDISSLNAFTASQETKNTTLEGVTSSLNSATASLFNSASLALTTGSIAGNILTFTKGDNQTFSLTIPSATGSVFDTGSFLTTGSLAFGGSTNKGNGIYQFNIATGSAGYAIELFNTGSDALYGGTGSMRFGITDPGNPFIQLKGQAWFQFGTGNQLQFQSFTSSYDNGIIIGPYYTSSEKVHLMPRSSSLQFSQDIGSGEVPIFTLGTYNGVSQSIFEKDLRVKGQFTASLQQGYAWVGNASGISTLVATSSFGGGGGTTFSNPNLQSNSGSLVLIANTFNSGSANLLHLSASTQTQANIVFKNNNNTGTTIISGSNNIFTNPNTPTTGYIKYVGGANNFYLNNTNGINSEITSSAISVSGTRPTMNNNIFQGTAALTINQAVNGGTHTYSNNLFGSANAMTINALAYTGSSFTVSDNIFKGATVTINPASASLAEIAAGVSGSGGGGIEVLRNMVLGTGTMAISVGPKVTSGFSSYIGNIINSAFTVTNISSSVTVGASVNNINQGSTYSNAGAAGLAIHRTAGAMNNNFGGMNLIASASAIVGNFNVGTAAMAVTNRMFSGSLGSGSLTFTNNMNAGGSNTYTVSGSFGGTGTGPSMIGNSTIGANNTIFTNVEGRGMYVDFRSNVIGGQNLILTGSNNNAITASGGGYFGRFNADDGRRNQSAENIFFVGTGTSASNRKTGFLIDSGSNTFVEGSLNVSGSTTLSGSLYIQSGSTLPSATGSSILTWNPTTGQVSQSPIATLISSSFSVGAFNSTITQSGSAAVSQSMTFNNTDISNGVSIVSNSQITLANSGTYNIQFSAQLLASTGADTIWIWLKKNGTNVSNTATKLVLKNNEASVAAWNFVVPAAASDYFELVWQSLDGHATLLTETAAGNYPAIPSIILTVTQVE